MAEAAQIASVEVAVEAQRAFEYLADGMKQGEWALGSWNRSRRDDGLYSGRSLFDGRELLIRLVPIREHLLVEYHVGRSPEALLPLVWARVVPGELLGIGADRCLISLVIWRTAADGDDTWALLGHTFPTEVQMIKGRLELGF